MPEVFVDSGTMTAIANAIRQKTGGDERMFPQEMPGAIRGIDTAEAVETDEQWILRTLKTVKVPEGVTRIAESLFEEFTELETAELPKTVTDIAARAFYGCEKLSITSLPEGIMSIGNSAFRGCTSLGLTKLPEGIKRIEPYTFFGCENLMLTELPTSLTFIDGQWNGGAFQGCKKLALTTLPEGITKLSVLTFGGCTGLVQMELPKSIETIQNDVFSGCIGLTKITFKGTPKVINVNAFKQLTNVKVINVPWAEGEVAGAPWGATKATICYNYQEGENGDAEG